MPRLEPRAPRRPRRLALLPITAACVLAACLALPAGADTFLVDSASDLGDVDLKDTKCRASNGRCTLRAAVEQGNFLGGRHAIGLSNTTYYLTSPLEVSADLWIAGKSEVASQINCEGAASPFEVGSAGVLTLRSLSVRQCRETVNDGGLWLLGVRFEDNAGLSAIVNRGGLSADVVTFFGNRAEVGSPGGGALYNHPTGYATIGDSVFQANLSEAVGGAIFNRGEMYVGTTRFFANHARDLGGQPYAGGAIYNEGQLSLELDDFGSNEGSNGGALANLGHAVVRQSSFHGNSGARGGAVWSASQLEMVNSTVSGNTAGLGGGLYGSPEPDVLRLANVTVTGNTAGPSEGVAIARGGGLYGAATLRNTILAANETLGDGPDCYTEVAGTLESEGYNLVGTTADCAFPLAAGDQTANGKKPLDPQLTTLNYDKWSAYHVPLSGSPVIDGGDPTGCRAPVTEDTLRYDQREWTRHVGAACDIGAVESR